MFNFKKNIVFFLLLVLILAACGKDDEALLGKAQSIEEPTIIFGEKLGEKDIKARNVFVIGEQVYFLIQLTEKVGVNELQIELKKHDGEQWSTLTKGPMPVQSDFKKLLNGLPNTIFEQTGVGAYKLLAYKGDELLVEGDFVIEEVSN